MNLENKIKQVETFLKDKKIAIGFSGGSDSTLLTYLSSKVAKDTLLITINNNLMPEDFIEHTKRAAETFNVKHEIIELDFLNDEEFIKNSPKRCYDCRQKMYSKIKSLANEKGFDYICDGNNISDLVSDRPGILITYAQDFKTPLIDARLTSKEIHEYLNKNNIIYSKSTTCLATRIPTYEKITDEKIERIKKSESYVLNNTNCDIIKVRDFKEIGICETDNIAEILDENKFNEIDDELKSYGFRKVALNLSPINFNETISIEYKDGSFSYKLPYTINIKNTKKINKDSELINKTTLKIGNIVINENGNVEGNALKSYEHALNSFMDILPKIRRNL